MNYPRVVTEFYSTPWAILPEKLREIETFVLAKASTRGGADELLVQATAPVRAASGRDVPRAGGGRVAVMSMMGVLSQRMNMFSQFSGGTSTELLGKQLDQLLADGSVAAIVIDIDSPGGSIFGTVELASKISRGTALKPIVAVANSLAASAAFWLGSQATEFVVTPGGQVGSIGVVAVHQDESRAEEMAGVRTTLIHAGKYKVEGSPSLPLSAEGAENFQSMVDGYYRMFVKAVARGRGVTEAKVERDYGQGRMKLAEAAKAAGMVDRIATLEETISRVASGKAGGPRGSSAGHDAVSVQAVAIARARAMECEAARQPGDSY